jgi:hypothetical protein
MAVALATAFAASPSQACAVVLSPAAKLAGGYKSGAISSVALVRITNAKYTAEPVGDAHPWQASGAVERTLRGAIPARIVRFERGWGSAACDDGRPPPKIGERWVVYFWRRGPGDERVWQSYPAKVAFEADPRLRSVGS